MSDVFYLRPLDPPAQPQLVRERDIVPLGAVAAPCVAVFPEAG